MSILKAGWDRILVHGEFGIVLRPSIPNLPTKGIHFIRIEHLRDPKMGSLDEGLWSSRLVVVAERLVS